MVCVALIGSDSLEWERTQLWALTFKLIRKIIGGVDYKVSDTQEHTQLKPFFHILNKMMFDNKMISNLQVIYASRYQ